MQALFSHFVMPLILRELTNRYGYNPTVTTPDAVQKIVLARLKKEKIRPTDLAKKLGVSDAQGSYLMSGQRGVARKHFEAVAELLGITVQELVSPIDPVRHTPDVQKMKGNNTRSAGVSLDKPPSLPSPEARIAGFDYTSPSSLDEEILATADAFDALALYASYWSKRVLYRLADKGHHDARQQTSMARAQSSGDAQNVRAPHRPPHRTGRGSK
jgi:transcriptional regulator with XRE-family HTH domain